LDQAELAADDGEVKVTIPRFSLSHDTLPPADNAKYLKPLINSTSLQHDSARDAQSDGSLAW
jgi:hypothetical protein